MLFDSLPAVESVFLDKNAEKLFSDCTMKGKRILIKILETAKKAFRENK